METPIQHGAIVGFGNAARFSHWPAYASFREAEIVAVVDESEVGRDAARKLRPSIATFSTLTELAASGLKIDFVDICTPPAFHAEPMLQALAQRWHVLCEKPFLLDTDVFRQARELAKENGRCLMPVHNWKYAPIIRAATNALRNGTIGALRSVEIETLRIQDSAVADPLRPSWRRNANVAGGGILMDHGWHSIYLTLNWFQQMPIQADASFGQTTADEVEDEATLSITFPCGNAHIFLSWKANRRWNGIRLTGQSGEIAICDDVLVVNNESTRFERALSAGSHHEDWFAQMLPDIVAAFRDPEVATAALDEAETCLRLIQQAYETNATRGVASARVG